MFRPGFTADRNMQAKRDHLEKTLTEYDAIFFGSSRVYRAFSPPQFNTHLAPNDQLKIFNYGVGSVRPHELDGLLRWVVRNRDERLKLVFVELMDWNPTILKDMSDSDRTIAWHDGRGTFRALETIWYADLSTQEKLAAANENVLGMLKHYTNYGGGSRWFAGRNKARATRLETVMAYADGFAAFDQETASVYAARRRQFFEENLEIFHEQVAMIDGPVDVERDTLESFNVPALVAQQKWLRSNGIEVVYVVPNLRWATPEFSRLQSEGHIEHLWEFNSPSRYPELYVEEHYFDRGHLNRAGANEFSRCLAERYSAWKQEAARMAK